jgi:hypothetical protein
VNNPERFPVVCLWTACEVRGMDPQAPAGEGPLAPSGRETGDNLPRAVRSLLHTGIPLCDWRPALFPIVPSPYSYNL